jgi:outer membrane protein assembly factor BamE (lipoprotein component of BamABCDE complex)
MIENPTKFLITALATIMLSSCVSRIEKSGYIFEDYDHNKIVKKITYKQTVFRNMGNPTLQTNLGEKESWIFLAEESRHLLFLKPKIISRKLLVVDFYENETVENLQYLQLENEQKNYQFHQKHTAVKDHKTNSIKELFGNIGTVKPL